MSANHHLNRTGILSLLFLFLLSLLHAQSESVDFNNKYKFLFSVGAEYQSLSPIALFNTDYKADYSISDVAAVIRLPLPFLPGLQPLVQVGMITFTSVDRINLASSSRFNHSHFYGLLGAGYSQMLSKTMEIGADLSAGLSEAIFNSIAADGSPRGSPYFVGSLGAKLALNVAYNLNVEVHPTIKYLFALTPLERFNGFAFGLGVTANYRAGDDPDLPKTSIRSIKFANAKVSNLFAAMQSYYIKHPIGKVTITNAESVSITEVDVSFLQTGFMDSQTKIVTLPDLKPGESREIDLFASFNQNVFTTEGVTPLTGEIIVDYNAWSRTNTQKLPVTYDLYDKESITWDDDKKVAAFITPADSAIRNYSSFIRTTCKDAEAKGYCGILQTAVQIFYALKEIGCIYQMDPTSPFEAAKSNPVIIDYVSLSRNTLKRRTGDCDDLTVLFCSMMETVGAESAFITVPGHIYAAFNTKMPPQSYKAVHPDEKMTLNLNGELWVPVEITMIGTSDFLSAWRTGIDEFKALDANPSKRNIYFTRKAQEIYRPVGLQETDLGLQYGDKSKIVKDFRKDMDKLVALVIDDFDKEAKASNTKGSYNKLGIACAQLGKYDKAVTAFNAALSLDRNYMSPKVNLSSVFFLQGEYQNALQILHAVEADLVQAKKTGSELYLKVLLDISKSYYELENYDKLAVYSGKLFELDPGMAQKYSYLTKGEGTSRAADIGAMNQVLFAEEE
jgi:tetratricopeptide (TPR) repeat protein